MKHLKRFNESVDVVALNTILEIQDFCQNCFAYLIDDNFEFSVNRSRHVYQDLSEDNVYEISLFRDISFKWYNIKDYYIPFIKLLSSRYNLSNFSSSFDHTEDHSHIVVKIGKHYSGYRYYTYDEIVNDQVKDSGEFTNINSIKIKVTVE